jgi:hypothetical protein
MKVSSVDNIIWSAKDFTEVRDELGVANHLTRFPAPKGDVVWFNNLVFKKMINAPPDEQSA